MKLHDLGPNEGHKKKKKRVGRGISAGQGKTAGRGTKGEGARRGQGGSLYRQGGQLPFYRSLPFKRGFTNIRRVEYAEVNVDRLGDFAAGTELDPAAWELLFEGPAGPPPRSWRAEPVRIWRRRAAEGAS